LRGFYERKVEMISIFSLENLLMNTLLKNTSIKTFEFVLTQENLRLRNSNKRFSSMMRLVLTRRRMSSRC